MHAYKKVGFFTGMLDDDKKKSLWEQKNKLNVDKMIDKNPTTHHLELKIQYYKQMINEFNEMPRERNAFYIQINFGSVIEAFQR